LEELASGSVFCQILDLIYDGMVPMQKVNWQSEKTSDWVLNFEVLTSCLKKFQVSKEIYVQCLLARSRG
jgi:RP/EB family microtubule-associated protein